MPAHESLDELLSRHAAVFADQVLEAAKMADTEEDIRIAIENQLAFIKKEAGITLVGKHEVTVVSGQRDSNCVST